MRKKELGLSNTIVSELCLGTMYFGTKTDQKTAFKILDRYVSSGGNFIDTANNYSWWIGGTGDESEKVLGTWMATNKNRNEVVLASKIGSRPSDPKASRIIYEGLRKETILSAVDESLKRLKTEYLDVCYIHTDQKEYPLEERLEALEILKSHGKIRYKGCSNISNERYLESENLNEQNKLSSFQAIQQKFSYLLPNNIDKNAPLKFLNKEMIDITEERGSLLLTYSVLLSGAYSRSWDEVSSEYQSLENKVLFEKMKFEAKELGCTPSQWVLRWVMNQSKNIIPLIAASSEKQLREGISSLSFNLKSNVT